MQVRRELLLTFIIPPPEIELAFGITPPRIMSYHYFLLHQELITAVNRRGRLQDQQYVAFVLRGNMLFNLLCWAMTVHPVVR